jgi:hypothetical protein
MNSTRAAERNRRHDGEAGKWQLEILDRPQACDPEFCDSIGHAQTLPQRSPWLRQEGLGDEAAVSS